MLPKVELKRNVSYYDEISHSTLTQGSVTPMIEVSQGTASNTRIGNQITVKGFHIKGLLNNNATTPNYIRMLLVWSPTDSATGFTTSYLFADANQGGGVTGMGSIGGANILYYPVNKSVYRPVWDQTFKLGGSGDPSCTRMFSKFIKMNTTIKFNGNLTGVGNQDKQLSLFVLAAEAGDDTGIGQTIELSHVGRTYFTDA